MKAAETQAQGDRTAGGLFSGNAARVLLAVAAVTTVVLVLRATAFDAWIAWFREITDDLGAAVPVAFVLLFIGLTVFCLPGMPLNLLAGIIFDFSLGGVLTVIASNSSAAVAFLIGRLARRRVARTVQRFPRAEAVYETMGKKGSWKLVAAVRLSHSLPFGLQNLLLGATPVSLSAYLWATFLVTLPGIFVMAYFGHLAATTIISSEAGGPLGEWVWLLRAGGLALAAGAIIYLGAVIRQAINKHVADTANLDDARPGNAKQEIADAPSIE